VPLPVGDISVYSNPFNANDAVNTPSGLQTGSPKVQMALADAVTDLQNAGIPLAAPLGDWQYEKRGDDRIPIHGGPGDPNGQFNAIGATWTPSGPNAGYSNIPHGSSFVMVTQFTDDPTCGADDRTILTYSQSEDPTSPYFRDQTEMFSDKQWVNPAFCENEVQAQSGNPDWNTTPLEGCLPAGCGPGGGDPGTPPGGGNNAATEKTCFTVIQGTKRSERLVGTDASERIRGRHGNDRIRGGGGEDCLHGGSGNDRINSADGGPDKIRCGRGRDKVRSDPMDSLRGCEVRR
jgi:acyl-homoserine-lactone acylase